MYPTKVFALTILSLTSLVTALQQNVLQGCMFCYDDATHTMVGTCKKIDGTLIISQLDMNLCVVNWSGKLFTQDKQV